jgi:Ketopantoate hydroxymethyltransferase
MISKIKKILNKKNNSKIICLTSYSKNIAEAIDPHTDIILVGDH